MWSVSLSLLLIAAAASSQAGSISPPSGTPDTAASTTPPTAEQPAAAASNEFGLDLYRALARAEPGRNLFISPYSMSVALAMAAEGARGETESEMAGALHFPAATGGSRTVAPVHQGYQALARRFAAGAGTADPQMRQRLQTLREQLNEANRQAENFDHKGDWKNAREAQQKAQKLADELNALLPQVDRYDLRVANALWVDGSLPLVPAYVQTIDRFYGTGGVTPMNFAGDPDGSRVRINTWVEDHTERRIKDLIPPGGLSPDSRLVITNAVYFLGQWDRPFHDLGTKEADFTLEGGGKSRVMLMHDTWRYDVPYAAFNGNGTVFATPQKVPKDETKRPATYPDDAGFTMIELPYKGGDLSMLVIAPRTPDGLAALESKLDAASLSLWVSTLERRTVDTSVPRFKLAFEHEMSSELRSLGMRRAFHPPGTPGGADFSGMKSSDVPTQQLFIDSVRHKAWVEVNEKGTEAAAATSIAMSVGAMARKPEEMVPFTPVFRADHPFLFLIRDTKTGLVLFIGRVAAPTSAG